MQDAATRVRSEEPTGAGFLDASSWQRLEDASSTADVADAWLSLQCSLVEDVVAGVLVLGRPDTGPFKLAANWPDLDSPSPELMAGADVALAERRGVVRCVERGVAHVGNARDVVAYPYRVDGRICGVVAVAITPRDDAGLTRVMRHLQWGVAQLALATRGDAAGTGDVHAVLDLLAAFLEHDRLQAGATALATALAMRFDSERAAVGLLHGSRLRVCALSHSAEFRRGNDLVGSVQGAMEEAADQQVTLTWPAPPESPWSVAAHERLAREHGAVALVSVPLAVDGRPVGALTLERHRAPPFDAASVALLESIAALVGPVLESKRRDERWLVARTRDAALDWLGRLIGPRHVGLKFGCALVAGLAAFLTLATGEYRVSANATIEGTVQQVVASPMSGYVATAPVRAGEVVTAGGLMATLDASDLELEHLRWTSEREQHLREYREALGGGDRARIRVLRAQVAQAEAQIDLLAAQVARTRIAAPFDGIVVSGDLSQALGAPVDRGQILFEVAPLDSYRVILDVDERDIAAVAPDQVGALALAALPGRALALVVERVTPVSAAEDGANFFRVEARLTGDVPPALRPGMEGVGKVAIGERRLGWIWGHEIADWLRLWLWYWWP